jgi:FkbM family methyltransferase
MKPWRLTLARLLTRPLPPAIAAHVSMRLYSMDRGWRDNYRFQLRSRTGSVYAGSTRDLHAHVLAIHGYYDWRLVAAARFLCSPGDTVVEVGANVGTETIALADIVGPRGQVYAFEPFPANVELLRLAVGTIPQIEIVPAALSDMSGTIDFVPALDERESGSGRIAVGTEGAASGRISVPTYPLDAFLANKTPVRLLVIDAEGAEVRILRGAKETLHRDRPVVIVEAQEDTLNRFGSSLAELLAIFEAEDYHVYKLARFGLKPANAQELQGNRNWLALPPSLVDHAGKLNRHLFRCGLLPCVRGLNPLARRLT